MSEATRGEPPPPPRGTSIGWTELAAGVVVGLLLAWAASWVGFGGGVSLGRGTWRSAVIESMDLYTPETFALANPDNAVQDRQLRAVSARLGIDVTPDKIALPALRYRTALILAFDGQPLAEIAYTDAGGSPVLFCVIDDGKPDAQPRMAARQGLSYVAWSRGGRSFMFVARLPEDRVAELALPLETRF